MSIDKSLLSGSTAILLLKLLEEKDRYGYEMIEALAARSDHTFDLKAGTLYPLLHSLENSGLVESYEQKADFDRTRKYYRLTEKGRRASCEKQREWETYASAMNRVLKGGAGCVAH